MHRTPLSQGRPVNLQVIQDTSDGRSKLGVGTLMGTAVPLIQQMLIDGKVAEGGGHELKVR